ncbi:MAG: S-layer homology domain-containing protein, partial [Defluviitaleaceae bacterium]|nr:S-layer homology domain-containing protein [Defluviitaleaceae bacterium]
DPADIPSTAAELGWQFTGWSAATPSGSTVVTDDITFTATFAATSNPPIINPPTFRHYHTVTFIINEGGVAFGITNTQVESGDTINPTTIPSTEARTGWYFAGWVPSTPSGDTVVTEDLVFIATFNPLYHTVTFIVEEGGVTIGTTSVQIRDGDVIDPAIIPNSTAKPGWQFTGWTLIAPSGDTVVTDNLIFTATYMPIRFHARFMIGYPEGDFRPYNSITRAEVATILVRTMTTTFGVDVTRIQAESISGVFSDVDYNDWFYDYIAIAYSYDLIQGFPDGTFRPDDSITREQFAAMLARTTTIRPHTSLPFIDAAEISAWAFDYVGTTLIEGFMYGDTVGTFRPGQPLSRAEAAAAINRILGRGDTTARSIQGVHDILIFPDAYDITLWFFYYVLEATNSHWYIKDGQEEIWIEVVVYP